MKVLSLRSLVLGLIVGGSVFGPAPASAQDTGTLFVVVRKADSTPLAGAFVRSDRIAGVANDSGLARVELPARLVTVEVSQPGFAGRRFDITILPNVAQRYELLLEPRESQEAALAGLRTNQTQRMEPAPVFVLGPAALAAGSQAHPTDLFRLFNRMPGLRVQSESGPLDGARFWADGLDGRYTGILVDGLPVAGGSPGAFDLRHFSPIEFEQAEWVRGPATAVAGPLAPGSLINLVPRRPAADELLVGINQSSEKGVDLTGWGARRLSPMVSATVLGAVHQQRLVDADEDGWGEFPRAIRFAIRPRLYLDRPNGDGISFAGGYLSEERTGGYLISNLGPDLYREERRTRRFDGSLSARRLVGSRGVVRFKLATVLQSISHRFDDIRERDRRTTVLAEATYSGGLGRTAFVAGVAYQRDALRQMDFPAFDYTHRFPSAFGSVTITASDRLTGTLTGRCDAHNVHGTQCVPRIDILLHPRPAVDLRLFSAVGYSAPTPLTGQAEVLGLHALFPIAVRAERTGAAGADVRWRAGATELGATVTTSRVSDPVRLVPVLGDTLGRLRLKNLTEPTRVVSIDLSAEHKQGAWGGGIWYGFRAGSEGIPAAAGRRDLTLVPTHQFGADLNWEAPGNAGTAAEAAFRYLGPRPLVDNPFRSSSRAFGLLDGLVSQRSGRARLYLSVENLFDVKLRNYEAVVLASPTPATGRTAIPWAPLRGRVISLGAQVDWGR